MSGWGRPVGADRDHRGGAGDGAAGFSARVVSVIASDGAGKSRRTRQGWRWQKENLTQNPWRAERASPAADKPVSP